MPERVRWGGLSSSYRFRLPNILCAQFLIDLMDGGPNLLDVRFADDILFLARSRHELGQFIYSLMIHLEQVGLLLNAAKTVVLTNATHPAPFLTTDSGLKLTILQRNVGQKWLHVDRRRDTTTTHRLGVSISKRLKYFDAVVSSVACFGSGHRAIYNSLQLATLDVQCRKLCRSIVGPPPDGMRLGTRFFIYGMNGSKKTYFILFFPLAPFFSTAEVSDSWTVLLGSLQALDETSWPFLSQWLRHGRGGAGQVQAFQGAGRRLGSGGGPGASARSWLQRGSFPSTLVRWVQSWSRRLAAKACKAAWVNWAVHRLMRAAAPECWRRRGACKCTGEYMVLHHMQILLEFGQGCCRFTCTSVGSTFAIVASFWYSLRGPSTTYLGIQTSCVLQVRKSGIMERSG